MVLSFTKAWWQVEVKTVNLTSYVEIFGYGLEHDFTGLRDYIKADETPFYQTAMAWAYLGITVVIIIAGLVIKGWRGQMAIIISGLGYLTYVLVAVYVTVANRVTEMGVPSIMYPDTTNVMDSPILTKYEMFPKGGARIEDIIESGNSKATLSLGAWASDSAAALLQEKCAVKGIPLKLPIGVKATDALIMAVKDEFGVEVPESLEIERGQVLDTLIDTHFHYQGKKVAIFGDPDNVIAMTEFLITMGMIPKYVITGTPGNKFEPIINGMLEEAGIEGCRVKAEGDLFDLHQWIKEESVSLLIGNSHGKYIARAEDLPFVRFGFPVMDRAVQPLMPVTGYRGCLRLIEMISNAMLDRRDRDCLDEDYELVL